VGGAWFMDTPTWSDVTASRQSPATTMLQRQLLLLQYQHFTAAGKTNFRSLDLKLQLS